MINIKTVGVMIDVASSILANEKITKFLCGTYSDGSARSLIDSLNGEYVSPVDKVKKLKKKKKKKKKW